MKPMQQGLSLMEVMVTMIIVAIIGGLAYPRYQKMVAKSKQTEAKTILRAVYIGQDLYKSTNQEYAEAISDLDVQLPSNPKYTYTLVLGEDKKSFTATATGNIDDDDGLDVWTINEDNVLTNTVNDALE